MAEFEVALDAIEGGAQAASFEGPSLDFKTDSANFKATAADMADAAVCFANAGGGTIVLGVRDKPTSDGSIVGTSMDAEALRERIHALTVPNLTVAVTEENRQESKLLVIEVPEGLEVYSNSKGTPYQRWGDECRTMEPGEVERLNAERRGSDWSAGPSGHDVEEADRLAVETVRELLRSSTSRTKNALAHLDARDLLSALELVRDDGTLNRAGALLLVANRSFGPRELAIYQHRKSLAGEVDHSRRWSGPLVSTFLELMETVSARIDGTPLTIGTGQQLIIEDFPHQAVREALANAVTHRDYNVNSPVSLVHSPDEFAVLSPGPLVSGVTPENFLSRGTKPRYQALARAFERLGWVEYLGQGFNRMFRAMASTGRPFPELDAARDDVRVVLRGARPDLRVARFVLELPDRFREDTNALMVLTEMCVKRSVTAQYISPRIQRSVEVAETVLRSMSHSDLALIEPTTGTKNRKHPNYRLQAEALAKLGSAVQYHRPSVAAAERKIVDHLREYGSINNATVQRMLDVDVYAARDILRDLAERAVIVRTSEQTRGIAVKYGPGENFPERKKRATASAQDKECQRPADAAVQSLDVPLFDLPG